MQNCFRPSVHMYYTQIYLIIHHRVKHLFKSFILNNNTHENKQLSPELKQ